MGPISPMLARLHAHLTAGSLDLRASAAERLFNLSAEDEGAQIVLSSPGGIRALVSCQLIPLCHTCWMAEVQKNIYTSKHLTHGLMDGG